MVRALAALGIAAAFAMLASCGGRDICLGCDGNSTPSPQTLVTVQGNVRQVVNPPSLVEDIGVVVCTDSPPDVPLSQCSDAFTAAVAADGTFLVSRVDRGDLRVGFWLDPDDSGMFAPDDLFGELQDPLGLLVDVQGGRTVILSDVSIDLGAMTATAAEIEIVPSTSPTPRPSPTS